MLKNYILKGSSDNSGLYANMFDNYIELGATDGCLGSDFYHLILMCDRYPESCKHFCGQYDRSRKFLALNQFEGHLCVRNFYPIPKEINEICIGKFVKINDKIYCMARIPEIYV